MFKFIIIPSLFFIGLPILFGIGILSLLFRIFFGGQRRSEQQTRSQQNPYEASSGNAKRAERVAEKHHEKFYSKDDGEYVDFEEIIEEK